MSSPPPSAPPDAPPAGWDFGIFTISQEDQDTFLIAVCIGGAALLSCLFYFVCYRNRVRLRVCYLKCCRPNVEIMGQHGRTPSARDINASRRDMSRRQQSGNIPKSPRVTGADGRGSMEMGAVI